MDNMPIDDFMAFARVHWAKIRSSIMAGTYQPMPVKRWRSRKQLEARAPLGFPQCLTA